MTVLKDRKVTRIEYISPSAAIRNANKQGVAILEGPAENLLKNLADESVDLIVTSPPYCIGMPYETTRNLSDFDELHRVVLPECARVLKKGGSLCWQIGYHVSKFSVEPLDFRVHAIISQIPEMHLRNRIIWTFGHGTHATKRLSGRHEVVLWYTKGRDYVFDLDRIRVRQKYPGKKHYKGPKKGSYSGNPLGKNPGDVWEIPNVKAHHPEKTDHPCQFPIALAQRLILGMGSKSGLVLDPFLGSGTTAVAAILAGHKFIGAEMNSDYVAVASKRVRAALNGEAKFRPLDRPIHTPTSSDPINVPDHFRFSA